METHNPEDDLVWCKKVDQRDNYVPGASGELLLAGEKKTNNRESCWWRVVTELTTFSVKIQIFIFPGKMAVISHKVPLHFLLFSFQQKQLC